MYRFSEYAEDMEMEWLRTQLERRNMTQRDLAQAIGMTEQMFSNVVSGRRSFKAREVDAIRRAFGYSLPEDAQPAIAVVGRIAAGGHLYPDDQFPRGQGLYRIERPAWVPASGMVAAEIEGSSAEPWALAGDIIFWRRDAIAVFQEDLGRPVIAELADGRIVLKRLAVGNIANTWTLLSINPTYPSIIDATLKWAARAVTPLPRDQIVVVP